MLRELKGAEANEFRSFLRVCIPPNYAAFVQNQMWDISEKHPPDLIDEERLCREGPPLNLSELAAV